MLLGRFTHNSAPRTTPLQAAQVPGCWASEGRARAEQGAVGDALGDALGWQEQPELTGCGRPD